MSKVVIAAGGTAGHVVPALAVADVLRGRGVEVEFIGGDRAEAELVPAAGYPLHAAAGGRDRPQQRPARGSGAAARGRRHRSGAPAAQAGRRGRRDRRRRLRGGARGARCPLAAAADRPDRGRQPPRGHEPAARAARGARMPRLPGPGPRRLALPRDRAVRCPPARAGPTAPPPASASGSTRRRPCLLVFGGSLGARRLNHAALDAFGSAAPCSVLHACGHRDYDELRARLEELGSPPHYRLFPYIEPFADALAAADLVASRAGGSVLELAAVGLPAILVPYPHATADHQTLNARHMERGRRGGRGAGRGARRRRGWRARWPRCSGRRSAWPRCRRPPARRPARTRPSASPTS